MKVLYFDCFSGISGDMVLGALIDLGIDVEVFKNELQKLGLDDFDISVEKKMKSSITVTDVDVLIKEKGHDHVHNHGYEKEQHHDHGCEEGHHGGHHHHHASARNLADIEKIIDDSSLKDSVKQLSKKIFSEIARAEAKVHNKPVSDVHFHEVGAIDSIVDIVGAAICIDLLNVDRIYSSPLHDGTGFIECQHGKLPVPVPAVMEMLTESKIPYIIEDVNTELITPTGIGIIKTIASGFGTMPPMTVDRVGYGAGKRETGRFNALRCVLGTTDGEGIEDNEIAVLETNIDDMNPEVLGYVMDLLFESGALDVFYTPVYMKKNRPGVMLTVLSEKEKEKKLVDIILKETSTLGIRKTSTIRYVMNRENRYVDTEFGKISVKEAYLGGIKKSAPEFEDCQKAAQEHKVPLWKVYNAAIKQI
ncbi:MAG TPA: nickel pincer cofactor biosynthesis protein LarC [Clostridiaceae bacterium]|nr:nickel pincer cofactor biosynthesis protein LarC [Clostridiaceae bacterium]